MTARKCYNLEPCLDHCYNLFTQSSILTLQCVYRRVGLTFFEQTMMVISYKQMNNRTCLFI